MAHWTLRASWPNLSPLQGHVSSCLASANIKAQLGEAQKANINTDCCRFKRKLIKLSTCHFSLYPKEEGHGRRSFYTCQHILLPAHTFVQTSLTALCSDAPAENFTVKAYKAVRPGSAQPWFRTSMVKWPSSSQRKSEAAKGSKWEWQSSVELVRSCDDATARQLRSAGNETPRERDSQLLRWGDSNLGSCPTTSSLQKCQMIQMQILTMLRYTEIYWDILRYTEIYCCGAQHGSQNKMKDRNDALAAIRIPATDITKI